VISQNTKKPPAVSLKTQQQNFTHTDKNTTLSYNLKSLNNFLPIFYPKSKLKIVNIFKWNIFNAFRLQFSHKLISILKWI